LVHSTIRRRTVRVVVLAAAAWAAVIALPAKPVAQRAPTASTTGTAASVDALLATYCLGCHNAVLLTAGLDVGALDAANPGADAETWERVVSKLRGRTMPPAGMPRPDDATYTATAAALERGLDAAWAARPDPGRIPAVHRLNRAEYNNAIRDLLAFGAEALDVTALLPGDETADGSFDNFAASLSISTIHLERYLSVARQVTRLAVGLPPAGAAVATFEIPLHLLQEDRQSEDLPLGSRGGLAIHHVFPVDGEYTIRVELQRQYQGYLKGMGWPQQVDVRLDGALLERFSVGGEALGRPAAASFAGDGGAGFAGDPTWEAYMQTSGDAHLEVRLPVSAGPHVVGVSFVREAFAPEGLPQPLQRERVIANDQIYMEHANIGAVEIGGPYALSVAPGDTPSRRAIFTCQPTAAASVAEARDCAGDILARLTRRAYRRPATDADLATLLAFYDEGRAAGGSFDHGVQFALERLLVDPEFLLRVYRDPDGADSPYRLTDLEVASRLSFFLWSTIPDDGLLTLAEEARLTEPDVLAREVARLLADPRAVETLAGDFAGQWLNLRRLDEVVVDPGLYPTYDLSLMEAFRRETELFVGAAIAEDLPVTALLDADFTYVNERLAEHYGISGVQGSRFRRVTLPDTARRGGILAQGAILSTTAYPNRTSPVLRGKWLADNIFNIEVPPPPPDVPALEEATPGVPLPIRERLARHRANPACASCQAMMDPLGFALEHFDVIGGWRTMDETGAAVDATGTTAGGTAIDGLEGLRALLLGDPEAFPRTVTEKLFAYALGRPLGVHDQPTVRAIVRAAAPDGYRWSSIIRGIVESPAFLMRAPAGASAD
jgi:hypothetical protein